MRLVNRVTSLWSVHLQLLYLHLEGPQHHVGFLRKLLEGLRGDIAHRLPNVMEIPLSEGDWVEGCI